jgi:hypothetical protein
MRKNTLAGLAAGVIALCLGASSFAQLVCLPAPRLLTTMPMGGQAGTSVEVTIAGDHIDEASELLFSSPKISAKPKLSDAGKPVPNTFVVTIAADAPRGVHEARVLSRLGVSSSRAFSVSSLREVTRVKPNTTLETALELAPNSICNASMTRRAVDFYSFQAGKGKRVVVDCAAEGIDSKLNPVLIVADARGRDLLVDRRGGVLDFTAPVDGKYVIKVHGLTFQGGPECFYRLALLDDPGTGPAPRQPSTATVSSFSWTPELTANLPKSEEVEPNNQPAQAQKITLPCEVEGRFYPAADVDTFEFTAKKGEEWWVEVASERLGLPTDPFVLVQRVVKEGAKETLSDVAELNDIPSPIKPSSNGYSYDGPVYDAGSADVLGKVVIKEDGLYRLQLRDLFGGTRTEPRHIYRLVVRKASPDFALVAWALHMNLRNGDRAALSKPITLRAGGAMTLEVAVVRRDGFDGEIEVDMADLPPGVTACGLKIPAGKTSGRIVISADENAPRSFAGAKIFGRAQIEGKTVSRPCRLASMAWPVPDASQEIPNPRLLADVPVSVSESEKAPVTIAPAERKVWEAKAGETLKVPLKVVWRSEFTGASIKLNAMGPGFEGVKEIDVPMKASASEVVLDLAALKLPPGEYSLALIGSAVAKYRENPEAVKSAEEEEKKAEQEAFALAAAAKKLEEEAKAAPADKKTDAENAAKAMVKKQKTAEAVKVAAVNRMKSASAMAAPKDIVDIVVSEPIRIRVTPKGKS